MLRLNAGGRYFNTLQSTLQKCAILHDSLPSLPKDPNGVPFLDIDPKVFAHVLHFLRTGDVSRPRSELIASGVKHQLVEWKLIPPQPLKTKEGKVLPNLLICNIADQFQQDAGVKRHGINVTYGCDGMDTSRLARRIRKDLNSQLSSTYWQVHKTHERA
eukprot:PhF_6_TR3304/c0_g1_i2/m.4658